MSVAAFFLVSAFLSPVLAGSILARISRIGPEAVAKDAMTPLLVLVSLAVAVAATLADFSLLKLVGLIASALPTLVLLLVSMVFITFPAEFSEQTP